MGMSTVMCLYAPFAKILTINTLMKAFIKLCRFPFCCNIRCRLVLLIELQLVFKQKLSSRQLLDFIRSEEKLNYCALYGFYDVLCTCSDGGVLWACPVCYIVLCTCLLVGRGWTCPQMDVLCTCPLSLLILSSGVLTGLCSIYSEDYTTCWVLDCWPLCRWIP